MQVEQGRFVLDREWKGQSKTQATIGKYDYGGLFLRMPWKKGIQGEVINPARQRNGQAEGQRAMWVAVGMQVEGREDMAHIGIFDHPEDRKSVVSGKRVSVRVDNGGGGIYRKKITEHDKHEHIRTRN